MAKPLVIVESPAKARTIARFLGSDFVVGVLRRPHPRPAPKDADEIPAALQGRAVGPARRRRRQRLQAALRGPQREEARRHQAEGSCSRTPTELYLATDEDREGESIAWHLLEVLSPPERDAGAAHGLPRDHRPAPSGTRWRTGATSTAAWSTPRRPAASSTASTATRCRPSCGARSCPGCRPAGCRAWPPASWSSGSGPACASAARRTPTSRARSPRHRPPLGATLRRHPRRRRRHPPGHRPGLRRDRPARSAADVGRSSTTTGARAWPPAWPTPTFSVQSVDEKPYKRTPVPAVHDVDAAAGGGPQAALHRPADHERGPAPVRERLHHLHAHRQHRRCRRRRVTAARTPGGRSSTAPSTCPTSPAATRRR